MSEFVFSTETSGTAMTPEHFSPHCVAEWQGSGLNGQAIGFENLNYRRGPRFRSRVRCSHPILILVKQGKGTAFGDQRIVALVSGP